MANPNMANREVCDLIFVDYSTEKPFLNLDFANVTTTELTGESMYAYGGKGHAKRIQFTGERGGTLKIETQVQTFKLWELITGGEVSNEAKFVVREELAVSNGVCKLSGTPVEGTINVYAENDDCGTELEVKLTGSEISITNADENLKNVIVYYMNTVSKDVQTISIKSTSFPKAFTVYGDTVMKAEDDKILAYKLTAYKCVPQPALSISCSSSGDPSTVTITCDLMADSNNNILDMSLIG